MRLTDLFSRALNRVIVAFDTMLPLGQWSRLEVRGYLDLIDLTNDQRQKVEGIRARFLPKVENIRRELHGRRMELADLLFAAPLERDKIREAVERISDLQRKLEIEVTEHIIEENGLLTPEQQRQFHAVILKQFSGGGLGIHDVRKER